MSLTVTLEERTERQLQALAQQQGLSTESFISLVLENIADEKTLGELSDTSLLQKLDLGLSEAQWREYNDLIKLRQAERLSAQQQQQLIAYTNLLEQANAKRMAVLAELAKRRGQSLETVMEDLGISSAKVL